ncbi:hypothetical protein F9B85_05395 [Heliorestis acidaminivorans]|uniref:KOW domain-containing protein n=1 Tax=Heliorestis acidaminivorans TaxID=553427 RepID=A0A6I0F203_9FIRM|nr:hypothetical protein [Heliorestis acidaminivorans]KAB2953348.1 hypothetical protein F9B85_05395 [Heliorestis acidaminivorans]
MDKKLPVRKKRVRPKSIVSPLQYRKRARALLGKVVVLQTRFRTFVGCLVEVKKGYVALKVFSRVGRVFITIRIPVRSIRRLIAFPCP